MLSDLLLKDFLNETASKKPVPGGGSIAALSAAISASLSEMVANLTIGKKKYEKAWKKMTLISEQAGKLRDKLTLYIDKDADAYNDVMTAYKMDPSKNREARQNAIQKSLKNAAEIPLEIASEAFKLIDFAETVVKEGNKNAVTDGLVAAMMARTAVLSALYNIKINLESIDDKEFHEKTLKNVNELEQKVIKKEQHILDQYGL